MAATSIFYSIARGQTDQTADAVHEATSTYATNNLEVRIDTTSDGTTVIGWKPGEIKAALEMIYNRLVDGRYADSGVWMQKAADGS